MATHRAPAYDDDADSPADGDVLVYDGATSKWLLKARTVVGYGHTVSVAETSTALTVVDDDTIPQSGEAVDVFSLAHTALTTTNKLLIRVVAWVGSSAAAHVVVGLWVDTTADCEVIGRNRVNDTGTARPVVLEYEYTPGDTDAHTYKVKMANSAGSTTAYLNRIGNGARYSDTMQSSITIMEIQA